MQGFLSKFPIKTDKHTGKKILGLPLVSNNEMNHAQPAYISKFCP